MINFHSPLSIFLSTMRIFLSGIMQGQRLDNQIDSQSYRTRIMNALHTHLPSAEVLDPWTMNPNSVDYDDEKARETFHGLVHLAGTADLLLAYIPRMSMGSAMEMWQANQTGVYTITVTPHKHHWAIKYTSDEILPDLETLLAMIENGRFQSELPALIKKRKKTVI